MTYLSHVLVDNYSASGFGQEFNLCRPCFIEKSDSRESGLLDFSTLIFQNFPHLPHHVRT